MPHGPAKMYGVEKDAMTPEGYLIGSDEDIQNEVDKMEAAEAALEKRREAYEKRHGPGTFKAVPQAMSQAAAARHRVQDSRKLAMASHTIKKAGSQDARRSRALAAKARRQRAAQEQ